MAQLLTGKEVSAALKEKMAVQVQDLTAAGKTPTLAILRVGERPDDLSYERSAMKVAAGLGIEARQFVLPADASQDDIAAAIDQINVDDSIHGCLMFRPLPKGIDETALCNRLAVEKDMDGIGLPALAAIFAGTGQGYAPCTAQACVEMCDYYQVPLQGKHVVVVGRSLVIGKPVSMLFLQKNATVTICHSRSENLSEITRQADIVVLATGRAKAYGAEYFSAGQTVLDVGINVDAEGNLCGDVDFDAVEPLVAAITPVPRGVGSVTTALLMQHVVQAAEQA
ncbi:MAG: tetrahydrofolate dehydrogenase/cyclohydrolase catalytic domain-containing protein [Eggerthellales bacterium]|nr:tetrahydrofolate dehydrogenase/cyclohydrolase catalytic domain-containing protein [Eggerthellales bacterium]